MTDYDELIDRLNGSIGTDLYKAASESAELIEQLIKQRDELLAAVIAAASLAPHESAVKALLDDAIASMKGGAACN